MTGPIDIRNDATEKNYWSEFENIWTSLLTYRYLGRTNPVLDQGVDDVTMPLRHDMRNVLGGIMAAPLSIAAAECGGMHDDLYIPNPLSSSLQIIDNAVGVTRVRVLPEAIKIGRSMGFSRSKIVDANDECRVIALSSGSAISLGTPPPGYRKVVNPPLPVVDSPQMPALTKVFGAINSGEGVWSLPELNTRSASPDAALHLGPQHVTLEAAATFLAEQQAGHSNLQIRHWQLTFVARGKVGPFKTQGYAYRGDDGFIAVEVLLRDCANENRPITMASALFVEST
ncbi:MAG: hypothetical protein WCY88_06530 [Spongiibacteraceae bacterium]